MGGEETGRGLVRESGRGLLPAWCACGDERGSPSRLTPFLSRPCPSPQFAGKEFVRRACTSGRGDRTGM